MAEVKIGALPSGPYKVEGPISLVGDDDVEIVVNAPVVYLCRCGGSANKPLCDGTHRKIAGFAAAEQARDEAARATSG